MPASAFQGPKRHMTRLPESHGDFSWVQQFCLRMEENSLISGANNVVHYLNQSCKSSSPKPAARCVTSSVFAEFSHYYRRKRRQLEAPQMCHCKAEPTDTAPALHLSLHTHTHTHARRERDVTGACCYDQLTNEITACTSVVQRGSDSGRWGQQSDGALSSRKEDLHRKPC